MARTFNPQALRRERRRTGMSKAKLARCVGCSEASIRHWESGIRHPGATWAARMADCFGIPLDALFGERR